jgi:hypothetical protein
MKWTPVYYDKKKSWPQESLVETDFTVWTNYIIIITVLVRPWENDCRFPLTWQGQIFTAGCYLLLLINKIK